eukprot:5732723-Amphidinium_carterae.1
MPFYHGLLRLVQLAQGRMSERGLTGTASAWEKLRPLESAGTSTHVEDAEEHSLLAQTGHQHLALAGRLDLATGW